MKKGKPEAVVDVSLRHSLYSLSYSAINSFEQLATVSAAATSLSQVTTLDQS